MMSLSWSWSRFQEYLLGNELLLGNLVETGNTPGNPRHIHEYLLATLDAVNGCKWVNEW